ncbi:MAG TPA: Rrf2 family transcriptional regulator [Candidatus Hydrogenedentes bacterium]|nr:Rrf2 family transcriptional regulator [Candidatus Hydrogenedentota bacterium]
MLTKTSLNAIQALVYITRQDSAGPVPPNEIAERLGASPTYLGKINTELAKANILNAHRGVKGGVTLARPPDQITLLEVVEACQGKILGDYCTPYDKLNEVCAFHEAMYGLQQAIIKSLQQWTLRDLANRPLPAKHLRNKVACRMRCTVPKE